MIKLGSLFSGIGAFEKALKKIKVDYELEFYCEKDQYASKGYSLIHDVPESMNLGDITKVNEKELNHVDVLTYGFPCQDISIAGHQKGLEHEGEKTRSGLVFDVFRIMESIKPKIAICENVKALTSNKFREEFQMILDTLLNLGYTSVHNVLNAIDYGIPQNRERVFIISFRDDLDIKSYSWPEPFDNGLRLKDLLEDVVDEKYYISQDKTEKLIQQLKGDLVKEVGFIPRDKGTKHQSNTVYSTEGMAASLQARDYKDPQKIKVIGNTNPSGRGMNGNVYAGNISPTLTTNKGEGIKMCVPVITPDRLEKRQNGRRFKENDDPMFTITAQDRHGILQVGTLNGHQSGHVYDPSGASVNICANGGGMGAKTGLYLDNYRIRKLTPKECFRLMGFDDADYQILKDNGISDSQLYKMAGNSIVVDVLEHIFLNIEFNKLNQEEKPWVMKRDLRRMLGEIKELSKTQRLMAVKEINKMLDYVIND